MSELTTFRDHARIMSLRKHRPDCLLWKKVGHYAHLCSDECTHPEPRCPGCVTDADRALWARLADEVDAYLSHEEEEALL